MLKRVDEFNKQLMVRYEKRKSPNKGIFKSNYEKEKGNESESIERIATKGVLPG